MGNAVGSMNASDDSDTVADHNGAAGTGVTLRPAQPVDREFLYAVYAASRADEMAMLSDWSEAQKEQFLRFQFQAQDSHYQAHYPDANYDIISQDGQDVGRLYIDRMASEIRIMDIALLPDYRNRGIGHSLIDGVLQEAAASQKLVSLHVEDANPAKRLYERMGFVVVGDVSFYKLMHWISPGHQAIDKTLSS